MNRGTCSSCGMPDVDLHQPGDFCRLCLFGRTGKTPPAVERATPYYYRLECDGVAVEIGFATHEELTAWVRENEPVRKDGDFYDINPGPVFVRNVNPPEVGPDAVR
jgi:hypothetical protein